MTVGSVITLFPSSKKEQNTFVDALINQVLNGDYNALEIEAQMANIEGVVKNYRANPEIKEAVLKEAETYGQKTFEKYNAKIEIKEVGVKYFYEDCGHVGYNLLCEEINRLTEKKKELEKIIKAHSEIWVETDTNTGETYEVAPVAKSSTTQAVLTIKP